MNRRISGALALVSLTPLLANPLFAQVPAAEPTQVSEERRAELTCAAAFAIVASEQRRGVPTALAFPPLAVRGKEYFVQAGARAIDEAKISREAVRDLMQAEVVRLQELAAQSNDPEATVQGVMGPCLARLDATVPPLATPGLGQCAAILQLAYDEVHGREGLSPTARDLKILATVLDTRERDALKAKGLSGTEIDRTIGEAREAMAAEAGSADGGVEKYDVRTCYELARPENKSHY